MSDFRKTTPQRRENPPSKTKYGDLKPYLREDFNYRCGYCGDHDYFRETYYEVDHFVPREHLKTLSLTTYSNLVYSCRSCNNSKSAKWPSGDETVHNNGIEGFIDPCHQSYPQQFERLSDGSIKATTAIGNWMWGNLALGNPIHRLKWKLEQLKVGIDKLNAIETDNVDELKRIAFLNHEYMKFEEQLRGVPNFE